MISCRVPMPAIACVTHTTAGCACPACDKVISTQASMGRVTPLRSARQAAAAVTTWRRCAASGRRRRRRPRQAARSSCAQVALSTFCRVKGLQAAWFHDDLRATVLSMLTQLVAICSCMESGVTQEKPCKLCRCGAGEGWWRAGADAAGVQHLLRGAPGHGAAVVLLDP